MLITEKVEIKWTKNNKKSYLEKGYKFTNYGDIFLININDLSKHSKIKIKYKCDYCNEIKEKRWDRYLFQKSEIIKDCCGNKECTGKKMQDVMIKKYGVNSAYSLKETKEKVKQTNLIKYGVEHPLQLEQYQIKRKNTNKRKYGYENPCSNPEIYNKKKKTCIEKYGVDHPCKNKKISDKISKKRAESMYQNGTAPYSKQQKYLHDLLGGELNYSVSRCWLDIAFPKEMIYIEYDGAGHNLNVKLGNCTQLEFDQHQMNREQFFKKLGWKRIQIISDNDYLPNDNKIIEIINIAKNYLSNNHNWIKFYINNNLVECSQFKKSFDFGELKKVEN